MSSKNGGDAPDVLGLSKSAAVDALVAADETRDEDAVAAAIDYVTEGDVVSRAGVESGRADASEAVSTARTSVESAESALSEVRTAAEDAPDVDVVEASVEEFEAHLARLVGRMNALEAEHRSLAPERDVYELARGFERLDAESDALRQAATELDEEMRGFEQWLRDPMVRVRELERDVEVIGDAVDDMFDAIDELAAADEPDARRWAELTLHHRLLELFPVDVRAELEALRKWEDDDAYDDVAARLDVVEERQAVLDERLGDVAREDWVERYGDDVAAFESELASFDPPVRWGEVRARFEWYVEKLE